jgi:citrate synthase
MGFPPEMFTVLFAIARTVGWLAQWQELVNDPEQKIARPRQIYTGQGEREFLPIGKRIAAGVTAR